MDSLLQSSLFICRKHRCTLCRDTQQDALTNISFLFWHWIVKQKVYIGLCLLIKIAPFNIWYVFLDHVCIWSILCLAMRDRYSFQTNKGTICWIWQLAPGCLILQLCLLF